MKILFIVVVIAALIQYFIFKKRHSQDYKEILAPILKKNDLEFVSSKFPGCFNIGPFPKFEVEFGRPQSSVTFLGRGEYNLYRIVKVSDANGQTFNLWALLEFEVFKLRRVRWRVEKNTSLPTEAKKIIEK